MKSMTITADAAKIGDALSFIESNLSDRKLNASSIKESLLLSEELMLKIIDSIPSENDIEIIIKNSIEGSIVRFVFSGARFELNSGSKDDIGAQIINRYGEKIATKYRNGINTISVIANRAYSYVQIYSIVALFAAIILGFALRSFASAETINALSEYFVNPIRKWFISSINMISFPVAMFGVMSILAKYSGIFNQNKSAKYLIRRYVITSFLAVILSYITFKLIGEPFFNSKEPFERFTSYSEESLTWSYLWNQIEDIVPNSIIHPFITNQTFPGLFLAVVGGVAINSIGEYSDSARELVQTIDAVFKKTLSIFVYFAPLAVFCSVLYLIFDGSERYLLLIITAFVITTVALVFMLVVYALELGVNKISPIKFTQDYFHAYRESIKIGSSIDAVSHTIRSCHSIFGIPFSFLDFSIPLGTNLNMDGNCIFLTAITLMLAKMSGTPLEPIQILLLFIVLFFLSIGAPGQAGTGIICVMVICPLVNVSIEVITWVIILETIVGSFVESFNTLGDVVSSVVVAKKMGLPVNV